ncbi:MAG: MerR family transcriptional regulator [Saprospiraceae bacterium]|nr:MerR family transcriptional regulator [Saprospiraceae bacterium]
MAVYSIKDLEKLTGIKAHTIRIWEQRYQLICPSRTKTNIRYYDDIALKLLLNIALLNKNGVKISKIAIMSHEEILEEVSKISAIDFNCDTQLDALTIAIIGMDEANFDHILSANIEQLGFERTMIDIIYPFLERLSLLWLTGSITPVQEHFMGYLLRQKVIVAIDKEPFVSGNEIKKFIVYLPEGERQELSLLFMHFVLRARQHKVIYLGQDITLEDLRDACLIHKPDYVFTLLNEPMLKMTVQQYVDKLAKDFDYAQILLSGYQVVSKSLNLCENVTILPSLDDTIEYIDGIKISAFHRTVLNGQN